MRERRRKYNHLYQVKHLKHNAYDRKTLRPIKRMPANVPASAGKESTQFVQLYLLT